MELVNDSLYEWQVKLFKVDPDSTLYSDMQQLQKKVKQDHIALNFKFPVRFSLDNSVTYSSVTVFGCCRTPFPSPLLSCESSAQ